MHLQLTWLLIAQMLSPVICMFIPMTAIALNGVLRLDLGLPVIYLSLLFFSLFPMVNAVFTVGFVAPYRRFTLDLLRQTVKVSAAQYSFTTAQSGMHGARRAASIPRVPS
ncbi:hypothetical protein AAVH_08185 [Aphelenchoides avenae]|nr:hypothetical protein AAVH_08185 [Aphelenchus avenae]